MDAAKASAKKILGKDGHHDTTIHERAAPAVQNETITRQEHERILPAVDREVHQDHYHTTEQPVQDTSVLPEQHHHREIAVEKRNFEHDNKDKIARGLEEERARYRDSRTLVDGEKTRSTEGAVTGEHVHHHVYENIQPVVNKQTVEPHVVHTTVPIHEVHHNETQHHASSALPAMSMADFKKQGGSLHGKDEKRDFFQGCPEGIDRNALGGQKQPPTDALAKDPSHSHLSSSNNNDTDKNKTLPPNPPAHTTPGTTSSMKTGSGSGSGHSFGTMEPAAGTEKKKPSLMDKLNPRKDANGDGVAGFMK